MDIIPTPARSCSQPLRLLRDDEPRSDARRRHAFKRAIERGVQEADGGQTTTWDTEGIKAIGRKLLAASRAKGQLRRKGA